MENDKNEKEKERITCTKNMEKSWFEVPLC